MVVMTSWAPTFAFSSAGMTAHAAPASAPPTSMIGTSRNHGSAWNAIPSHATASPPMKSWPSAPMLNRPERKP